jgi:hypothetical protein
MKHSTRAACHPNIPRLQNLERHERRIHQVPQFMGEEPEALAPAGRFPVDARLISLAPVLGHRARDGIVQASVQRPKVVGADRCVQFHRQLGYGLTHIAIIVYDLRHGESLKQEVMSMLDRAPADLGTRKLAEA